MMIWAICSLNALRATVKVPTEPIKMHIEPGKYHALELV